MPHFTTVGIIAKSGDPLPVRSTLNRLDAHLRFHALARLFDAESARLLAAPPDLTVSLRELAERSDLIIVVGGDGTLLQAARATAAHDVPLLGINLGRLGFLVDVSPEHIETVIDQILAGDYQAETRSLLRATVMTERGAGQTATALNDVAIHKWNTARMIEFETYLDGVFINAQRSDGLIIATPTGSTAYALSGGGPLVDPALDATLLVPICPHDLSQRPLVIPADRRVDVRICELNQLQVQITCDGQTPLPLPENGWIRIERHADRVRLLHPSGHNHYQIMRAKLHWGGPHAAMRAPAC
ncbi:NAD kinase [Chromatium weissei]|nr:NAD kinase [Chromatium weissei]